MADVIINDIYLSAIADAIRLKLGTSSTYTPSNMAAAIRTISGGSVLQEKTVSPTTSQQLVTPDTGYDGLSSVTVNAITAGTAGTPTATKGTVSNHSISITPKVINTTGYITGGTKTGTAVTVSASELVSGNKAISANGTNIDVTNYATISVAVDSDVIFELVRDQTDTELFKPSTATFSDFAAAIDAEKTIALYINEDAPVDPLAAQYWYMDEWEEEGVTHQAVYYVTYEGAFHEAEDENDYDYYYVIESGVHLNEDNSISCYHTYCYDNSYTYITPSQVAEGATYIGQTGFGVGTAPARTDNDVQSVNNVVTVPAGIYANSVTYTITKSNLPNTLISTVPASSQVLHIGRSTSDRYLSVWEGYYNSGYYKIDGVPDGNIVMPSDISATTGVAKQIADNKITLTRTMSIAPTVTSGYVSSNGAYSVNAHISLECDMPTQVAQTIHPSTSDQTISSSRYLTGTQTIKAVTLSNLTAENIKQGVTVTVGDSTDADCVASVTGTYAPVSPTMQTKSVTPTESSQTVSPDTGYDGLSSVSVGAISSTYVGSQVARNDSSDLTASGATVTVPAGYYSSQATKSVTTMTLPTSASASATSGYTSKATISRSTSDQYINIAPGYNSAGGYYKISAVANGSATGPSNLSASSASITTGTNTITLTKTNVSTTPTVSAGYISSATASTATVALTASVTAVQGTKTWTPTTSDQTISANTFVTGVQTIKGDANLVSENIKDGTSIFGVPGSYSGASISNQNKTVTPTETEQSITADTGYTGLGTVTVEAISSTYVGSGITRRSSSNLTASGATVTAPAGYYAEAATKSVSSMTLPTATSSTSSGTSKATITPTTSTQYLNIPTGYNGTASYYTVSAMTTMTLPTSAASSATSGYTSKATIGRSTSNQYINIPPGYNSAGGYYTISAVANGSVTAPSSISGTTATVSTGTNTLTLTKTVSVTPNVTTAGYISSGTAGNSSVSLTASVTTKAAATITPGTTNQTIAAGTYITGTQTISGDADLVGSNILSTANIFGVQGTVVIQSYYTGSSAPSSSLGNDGDLYLQV